MEITGYQPEEFIANLPNWREIILKQDLPTVERDNNLLISRANYSTHRSYRIIRQDRQVRWVNEHIKNICDDTGKPLSLEGFIEDITDIKKVEELEQRVHDRTMQLTRINRELEAEREALQQKNLALKEILNQIEDEKKNMSRQIQLNIDRVALPIFSILEERIPAAEQHYIRLLRSCVSELSSPFISCLETKFTKLTPRETEICQMIKNGFSSKQIAKSFNNSLQTILKQRKVIRKKLKIANKKINLASYLKSLQ